MKRIVFLSAVAALLPAVTQACIRVDGTGLVLANDDGDVQYTTTGLRHDGDVWGPADSGCNLIPCGVFGNDIPAAERLTFSATDNSAIRIKAALNNIWQGGHVEISIKYGSNPNFRTTPGMQQGVVAVAKDSDIRQIIKTVQIDPAYNLDATIQVAYHTDGLQRKSMPGHNHKTSPETAAQFYQCIDIRVTDGQDFPADVPPKGLGPYEAFGYPVIVMEGKGGDSDIGLKPFWIAVIVLALLIALGLAIMLYLWQTRKVDEDNEDFEPVVAKVETVPEPPVKPATPPPEPEIEEAVAQIHYKDEEVAPAPAELPGTGGTGGTGSQGRHFHFRYVEEE